MLRAPAYLNPEMMVLGGAALSKDPSLRAAHAEKLSNRPIFLSPSRKRSELQASQAVLRGELTTPARKLGDASGQARVVKARNQALPGSAPSQRTVYKAPPRGPVDPHPSAPKGSRPVPSQQKDLQIGDALSPGGETARPPLRSTFAEDEWDLYHASPLDGAPEHWRKVPAYRLPHVHQNAPHLSNPAFGNEGPAVEALREVALELNRVEDRIRALDPGYRSPGVLRNGVAQPASTELYLLRGELESAWKRLAALEEAQPLAEVIGRGKGGAEDENPERNPLLDVDRESFWVDADTTDEEIDNDPRLSPNAKQAAKLARDRLRGAGGGWVNPRNPVEGRFTRRAWRSERLSQQQIEHQRKVIDLFVTRWADRKGAHFARVTYDALSREVSAPLLQRLKPWLKQGHFPQLVRELPQQSVRHILNKHAHDPIPFTRADFTLIPEVVRGGELVEVRRPKEREVALVWRQRIGKRWLYVVESLRGTSHASAKRPTLVLRTAYWLPSGGGGASTVPLAAN